VSERKRAEEALSEAEERYRTLVEQIPAVTYVDPVDDPDNSLYTSPQIERMLGYTPEEWRNERLWPKRLHPDDRERILAADERFERGGDEPFDEEYRLLAKDGSVVWVREEAVLVTDDQGKPLYWQGLMYDVTDRKEAEEALRRSEERYRTVVEEQTELVCRFAPDLTLTFVNGAYCRYFDKRPEELVGASFIDQVHEADRGYYEDELVRLNPESPTATVEERVFAPGGVRWLQWTDTAIFDAEGRTVEYQSVGRDVTERRHAEQRLEHQALHDPLTGLPNRRLFVDRLGQALRRTRREEYLVAVLFMDLDDFKVVNDSLGHEAGDLLLTVVARRLRRCLRPGDTLARFGGDEFVVVLEDVEDPGEAVQVAERIADELRRPFVLEGRELYATASIGISWGKARTKSAEDLLRDADTAMYQAKRSGSDYRVFDPDMYERVVRRLKLENDLRRAVGEGEFVVHYQPIFDFASREPWGVEALVRWDHPEMGLLGPSEFVPLAEGTGLIVPIGAWVLEEACRRTKGWQDSHPSNAQLGLIVNLSAKQLRHPSCEQTIKQALARSGLAAGSLSLDVTESAFIDAVEANAQALKRIQALGVRISIDDFGMGYSSLSYLKRLPADALKIDKSFVKGFGKDAEDTAIVRMVIDVAHTLGLVVVAEGVETWAQAALLAETGCDMAQGFHFAEPLPPEAAGEFLNSTYQGPVNRNDAGSLSDS
jgi:diguanylate cyclase (GGDEF)-like protein/PAS domain S-box-containing protein